MAASEQIEFNEPLIEVSDGKVRVKTMRVSMSRVHKITMLIDMSAIVVASLVTPIAIADQGQMMWKCITGFFFVLALVCGVGKMIVDFANWMFTMNHYLDSMGARYVKDVSGIVRDFVKAGVRLCNEELEKAKEENAAPKPRETKAEEAKAE